MLTLPPIPQHIVTLNDSQRELLEARQNRKVTVAQCVTCAGTKTFRWYDESGSPADYECPCIDQFKMFRWLSYRGMPESAQRALWSDLYAVSEDVTVQALDYIDRVKNHQAQGDSLVLYGSKGVGKTLLASLVVKSLAYSGVDFHMLTFAEMVDQFAQGWSSTVYKDWFAKRVRAASLLYVDDLGRERRTGGGNPMAENMLEEVVRHRVSNMLPTILTTNLTPTDISHGYGDHTYNLLAEVADHIQVAGSNQRYEAIPERRKAERVAGLKRPITLSGFVL